MREYTYKNFSLQLFNGKLILPLRALTSSKPDSQFKLPLEGGLKNRKTKQIYVLLKNGHKVLKTLNDVEDFVTSWKDLDRYLVGEEGEFKNISEFDGLDDLIHQNELKKNDNNMEILGIYDMANLSPKYYNGRQYYTKPLLAKQKEPDVTNKQMYQCLAHYLNRKKCYMLVRYFSKKEEELAILYADDGYLRLSGVHPYNHIKDLEPIEKLSGEKELRKLFSNNLKKTLSSQPIKPEFKLEWAEFYLESLKNKGVLERKTQNKKYSKNSTGSNLMEMLQNMELLQNTEN